MEEGLRQCFDRFSVITFSIFHQFDIKEFHFDKKLFISLMSEAGVREKEKISTEPRRKYPNNFLLSLKAQ